MQVTFQEVGHPGMAGERFGLRHSSRINEALAKLPAKPRDPEQIDVTFDRR